MCCINKLSHHCLWTFSTDKNWTKRMEEQIRNNASSHFKLMTAAQYNSCMAVMLYNNRCLSSWPRWQVDGHNAHSNTSLVGTHRRNKSPSVGFRVIALDCVQIRGAIITTNCIQLAATGCKSHAASLDIHWSNSSPKVSRRVVAFNRAKEHVAIIAASYIDFTIQCSNSKSASLWQHWRSSRPCTRDTVVYLHLFAGSINQIYRSFWRCAKSVSLHPCAMCSESASVFSCLLSAAKIWQFQKSNATVQKIQRLRKTLWETRNTRNWRLPSQRWRGRHGHRWHRSDCWA